LRLTKTRALGQHFLADRTVLARIIDAAAIKIDEIVCEAGTGNGILTKELCKTAGKVISFEVDRALFRKVQETLVFPNLEIKNMDLFRIDSLQFDVFVSNLPYSRSRDAFRWLATKNFKRAVVMLQKEFVDKIMATPSDKDYRAITVISSHCFRIERLFNVDRKSFEPPPSVDSEVIRFYPVHRISADMIRKINLLFSQRNKKASSVAAKYGISNAGFGERRIDQLAPDEIISLMESAKG
jgi:16S rRNA (adenine1518-N6/adenine1519-N6)-dimethyltransferase